ncbi:MAG: lysylphosphatidylglycerol synthase transmembrane domain-containing protein [Crocinitomicaceae bacterium]
MDRGNLARQSTIQNLLSGKRILLAIFLCLAITGFIYWRELDSSEGNNLDLNWTISTIGLLAMGLFMMAMRDLAYMLRIRILTDKKLSWKQAFNVIMLWEFASALSPGVVGGSAVALFILEREKISFGRSTAIVIITLIFDNLFYLLFIPLIFFTVSFHSLFPADLEWFATGGLSLFWIAYVVILILTLIFFLSVFYSPKIIQTMVNLIFKLPYLRRRKEKAEIFGKDIILASKEFRSYSVFYWFKVFGTTVASWISRFLVLNFVLYAFIELGLMDHLIILARQLLMWLAMLVTPTPGGSGMAEFVFAELFIDYTSKTVVSGATLALIWRTLSYYPYLLIGSVLLPRWLRKNANTEM